MAELSSDVRSQDGLFSYIFISFFVSKFKHGFAEWGKYGIMIAQSAIQTDKIGLPRFAGIIPGKPRLEK